MKRLLGNSKADYSYEVLVLASTVRSGNFNLTNSAGTLRNAGGSGHNWSSRGADNVWGSTGLGGYDLNFNAADVHPSWGPDNRWLGFPPPLVFAAEGADLSSYITAHSAKTSTTITVATAETPKKM